MLDISISKGIGGITYWYQVKADCSLCGVKSSDIDNDEIMLAAQSVFQFALTDNLIDDNERALIQVTVSLKGYVGEVTLEKNLIDKRSITQVISHMKPFLKQSLDKQLSKNDKRHLIRIENMNAKEMKNVNNNAKKINNDTITELLRIQINTWMPSPTLAQDIVKAFNGYKIVILLHIGI